MKKAKIKVDENTKMEVLFVDEKPKFCPYKTPILVEGQFNQPVIMHHTCNTSCPLMVVEKNVISLHCGCEKVLFQQEEGSTIKMDKN